MGIGLATSAREYAWLWDVEHGNISVAGVAKRERTSRSHVRQSIARARRLSSDMGDRTARESALRPPHLEPLFPIDAYTPLSVCTRHGGIWKGSCFVCMICHLTGQEGHPALIREWVSDPKPEPPPPEPPPDVERPHVETRRERRLRLFGPRPAQTSTAA